MAQGLIRRRPLFSDFADLHNRLDRLFEDVTARGERREWTPAIDVVQNDDSLVLRVEMPGIKPDDVRIEVEDDVLTVSGEHEESKEEKDERFIRRERRYGSFSRSIALPPGANTDSIAALGENGVVEVTVPLEEQKAATKTVQVKPKTTSES